MFTIAEHIDLSNKDENFLINLLEEEIKSAKDLRRMQETGENYYNQRNEVIMNRKKNVPFKTSEGKVVSKESPFHANHKLPSGFAKKLIKQKINYLMNDSMSFDKNQDTINELFPNWKRDLRKLATRVSYKVLGAWQFYIERDELKYKLIDGDQLIVKFNDDKQNQLDMVTRVYKKRGTKKAEIWVRDYVFYFIDEAGSWELDKIEKHINRKLKRGTKEEPIEPVSWGRPPFAVLYNNDEELTDVYPIKPYIDVFDITESDFANNIDDFQEIFYLIKNFGGTNLGEFLNQIKNYRVANTPKDGEVDVKQLEVPVEARNEMLEALRRDIYEFGYAVDTKALGKQNVSVIQVFSMYNDLDMKCNDFEAELQDFWNQVLYFIRKWAEIVGENVEVESNLVFDRSLPSNIMQMMELINETAGDKQVVSLETLRANHPLVKDPEKEAEKIKEERKEFLQQLREKTEILSNNEVNLEE